MSSRARQMICLLKPEIISPARGSSASKIALWGTLWGSQKSLVIMGAGAAITLPSLKRGFPISLAKAGHLSKSGPAHATGLISAARDYPQHRFIGIEANAANLWLAYVHHIHRLDNPVSNLQLRLEDVMRSEIPSPPESTVVIMEWITEAPGFRRSDDPKLFEKIVAILGTRGHLGTPSEYGTMVLAMCPWLGMMRDFKERVSITHAGGSIFSRFLD